MLITFSQCSETSSSILKLNVLWFGIEICIVSDSVYRDFGCEVNRVIERHGRSEITMVKVVGTIEKSAGKWAKIADAALPLKLIYSGNNGLLLYAIHVVSSCNRHRLSGAHFTALSLLYPSISALTQRRYHTLTKSQL